MTTAPPALPGKARNHCFQVMNAVVDALLPYGITHLDMPATPERIWQTIQAAQQPAA